MENGVVISQDAFAMAAVYWNRTQQTFLVQAMWKKPTGGSSDQGEPAAVPETSFDDHIAEAVLEALDKYETPYDPTRVPRRSDKEYDAFIRTHISVAVEREGDAIKLFPMRKRGRGYAGIGTKLVVRDVNAREKLPQLLRRSFEVALNA